MKQHLPLEFNAAPSAGMQLLHAYTRYTHVHHVPHAEHGESSIELAKCGQHDVAAVLCLSISRINK